jgi:glycosyltransferase involved in cell wall biosynthesis
MRNQNYSEFRNPAVGEFLSKDTFRFHGSEVLVFIPVRNEEYTIAKVVSKVRQSCNFDLLIIDDGSTDSTPHILQEIDVEVLTRRTHSGSRIISGLEVGYALGYKYVVKIDGDDQHDPQDIHRLYEHAVKTGMDIVVGSRHLNGFDANILSIEGSGMWFCSKLVSLLSRKRITDTTSGLKIWNRRACEVAIQAFKDGKLKEGSTHHVEELIIAARKKLRVEEISVVIRPREYGESKSYSKMKLVLFPLNLVRSIIRGLF